MFKLQLKGFKPLKDMCISSEDNIFTLLGDYSIGVDFFLGILYHLGRLVVGVETKELFWLFEERHLTIPGTLEFRMELDDFQYHVILKKTPKKYRVELEEMIQDGSDLFHHERTQCSANREAPDDQLFWKVLRHDSSDYPFLETMQTWEPRTFINSYVYHLSPMSCEDRIHDVFRDTVRYKKRLEKYIDAMTDVYANLKKPGSNEKPRIWETDKKEYQLFQSWKLAGVLSIVRGIIENTKVIWRPELVIGRKKSKAFYEMLRDFAKTKPIFVVTDDPAFQVGKTIVRIRGTKNSIVCESEDN